MNAILSNKHVLIWAILGGLVLCIGSTLAAHLSPRSTAYSVFLETMALFFAWAFAVGGKGATRIFPALFSSKTLLITDVFADAFGVLVT
jgi:hypothetical protein